VPMACLYSMIHYNLLTSVFSIHSMAMSCAKGMQFELVSIPLLNAISESVKTNLLLLLQLLQSFYSSLDFVWDYPGEPVPAR